MKNGSILKPVLDVNEPYDADDPEAVAAFWDSATVHKGVAGFRKLRGQRGPQKAAIKEPVSIRYNPAVLAAFRQSGEGWQTRMNAALEDWLKDHAPGDLSI